MRVLIDVTQEDILYGKRTDCERCPIARATARALPGYTAHVFGDTMNLHRLGKARQKVEVRLPWYARQFLDRFDNCQEVAPFKFTVQLEA